MFLSPLHVRGSVAFSDLKLPRFSQVQVQVCNWFVITVSVRKLTMHVFSSLELCFSGFVLKCNLTLKQSVTSKSLIFLLLILMQLAEGVEALNPDFSTPSFQHTMLVYCQFNINFHKRVFLEHHNNVPCVN